MNPLCSQYDLTLKNLSSFNDNIKSCSWMNLTMALPTAAINLCMIIALVSSSERSKPVHLLLLNLAVTDVLTGLINMPAFFLIFRYLGEGKDPCDFAQFNIPLFMVLGEVSLITVTMIAIERYISVFHPFRHISQLSRTKITICALLSWFFPTMAMGLSHVLANRNVFKIFIELTVTIATPLNLILYFRILMKARKLRVQIQSEEARLGHARICTGDKRFVSIGGLIIISMLICFVPAGVLSFLTISGYENMTVDYIVCWVWTLVLANSLINPLITCRFCPTMRHKVLKILTCGLLRKSAGEQTSS